MVKDRVGKIKTILAKPDALKGLANVSPYVSGIGGTTILSDLSVDSTKVDLALNFKTNADLSNFMTQISHDKNFGLVDLTTFGFNSTTGYSVEIVATNK